MERRKIKYNIIKVYENGVRAGHVPEHKNDFKRTSIGQAWFSEDCTVEDIRKAGQYVLSHRDVVIEVKDLRLGNIICYKFYSKYRGVTIGIFTDKYGKLSDIDGTIYPDSLQRNIGDIDD